MLRRYFSTLTNQAAAKGPPQLVANNNSVIKLCTRVAQSAVLRLRVVRVRPSVRPSVCHVLSVFYVIILLPVFSNK